MNSVGDIMKGGISAILISIGCIVALCGILCLIWVATGTADVTTDILWCGVGCLVFAAILMGSGTAWYCIVKTRS